MPLVYQELTSFLIIFTVNCRKTSDYRENVVQCITGLNKFRFSLKSLSNVYTELAKKLSLQFCIFIVKRSGKIIHPKCSDI